MILRQLMAIFALATLFLACTKEPQVPGDDTNPVDNNDDVMETVLTADTGIYFSIRTQSSNYGLTYNLEEARLNVVNDTLRLGIMRLMPTSSTEAVILPFPTSVSKTTSNGYVYQVEGLGSGTLLVNGTNIQAKIKKVALDSSATNNEIRNFYNGNPSVKSLNRTDYTGKYQGYFTNYSQQGTGITVTVEPLSGTENGVWLKELNREGYIDNTGKLVLPEMPVDTALYGEAVRYAPTQTMLQGRLLRMGQQTIYGNMPPAPNDHRAYTLIKI